jgi:hypothetical protein
MLKLMNNSYEHIILREGSYAFPFSFVLEFIRINFSLTQLALYIVNFPVPYKFYSAF